LVATKGGPLKKVIFALALLFVLISCEDPFAPIPSNTSSVPGNISEQDSGVMLNIPLILQNTPVWCWVASAEMVIRYKNYGNSLQQCQMLEIGFQTPSGYCCSNPNNCMTTGTAQQIQYLVYNFGGRASSLSGPLSEKSVLTTLKSNNPVIAFIKLSPFSNSGHVVVIRGIRFSQDVQQAVLTINDPLSYISQETTYANFLQYWQGSIIIY
jgi:hypothetical protein